MEIEIINDFDSFFQNWAEGLKKQLIRLNNTKIEKITVNCSPYLTCGLSYDIQGSTLNLEFYSAVRAGFGSIGISQLEFASFLSN